MTGLPRSIIKKYGVSKKAWSVFRAGKRTKSTKKEVKPMARRRKSFARKAKHYARSSFGNMSALVQPDAMLYGAVREKMSMLLDPVTSKIPLGSVSDEVGMGLALWLGTKYLPKGIIRNAAVKGLAIENARLGEQLIKGGIFGSQTNTTSGLFSGVPNY